MTNRTQPHHNRPSTSLAYLAALDLSSDDIVRPELCNDCIPAGKRILRRHPSAHDQHRIS